MKVHELIEKLQQCPPDHDVVVTECLFGYCDNTVYIKIIDEDVEQISFKVNEERAKIV